jgi:hypothetical protein
MECTATPVGTSPVIMSRLSRQTEGSLASEASGPVSMASRIAPQICTASRVLRATIELYSEESHRSTVHSELSILVLSYGRGGRICSPKQKVQSYRSMLVRRNQMAQRMDYDSAMPAGVEALNGVYDYIMHSGLPKALSVAGLDPPPPTSSVSS